LAKTIAAIYPASRLRLTHDSYIAPSPQITSSRQAGIYFTADETLPAAALSQKSR
jgi:hypothetical protein